MRNTLFIFALASASVLAQGAPQPDWSKIEPETLQHFQAIVRMNTMDPPGGEKPVVDYLRQTLEAAGIPTQTFVLKDANRPNLVARIKGNGKKKPLLLMGHTDTVTVDEKK